MKNSIKIPENFDPVEFIHTYTKPMAPSILPELSIYTGSEVTPLWELSENKLHAKQIDPPFWAYAWPGGQGIARYLLDHPEAVRGKRVLDFAAGSGVAAIAAMKAGADHAIAVDIDYLALHAIELNAALNGVVVEAVAAFDTDTPPKNVDLIIVGDVCYQQAMAARIMRWLWLSIAGGVRVIMGDPGRAYIPHSGLKELAHYTVPTSRDLEPDDSRHVRIWDVGLPTEEV